MRLSQLAEARVKEVAAWDNNVRYEEYLSLIQHTDEDALDAWEMLTLGAICLVFSRALEDR